MSEIKLRVKYYSATGETFETSGIRFSGKFVLVSHNSICNLVFGPLKEFPYHANLLDRFCDENEIPAGWVHKSDLLEIYDPEVSINGGGWIEIDGVEKNVRFEGYSTAYGKYDRDKLSRLVANHSFFEGYDLSFE